MITTTTTSTVMITPFTQATNLSYDKLASYSGEHGMALTVCAPEAHSSGYEGLVSSSKSQCRVRSSAPARPSGPVHLIDTQTKHTGREPRKALTDSDWQRIRPVLEELYLDEDKSLKDTMVELKRRHNFDATIMQYKKRINRWGWSKNLKQHEVEHILGIQAQRKARGKLTEFTLHGRWVDMQEVFRYQRRKGLATSVAISNYNSGRRRPCQALRASSPHLLAVEAWRTPDQHYENTLRAFGALFGGLVDSRYYWMADGEIVMPQSDLRGEVSDLCCNLVASKRTGLNPIIVRKLALLLEQILHSDDAWTHCRLIYVMWVLSTQGHTAIVQSLLSHLKGLAEGFIDVPRPQYRFVQHYSSLNSRAVAKFAADIITLKADMVGAFRVDGLSRFRLRSLEYDVFWREREQGTRMSAQRAIDFFHRCHELLGLLAVETLTALKIVLEDFSSTSKDTILNHAVDTLSSTVLLAFSHELQIFTFDGQILTMEAAAEMAHIYCLLNFHVIEAWMIDLTLTYHSDSSTYLRRPYGLILRASQCGLLLQSQQMEKGLKYKAEIESRWIAEVDAIASKGGIVLKSKICKGSTLLAAWD